jgi:hypothetical protein
VVCCCLGIKATYLHVCVHRLSSLCLILFLYFDLQLCLLASQACAYMPPLLPHPLRWTRYLHAPPLLPLPPQVCLSAPESKGKYIKITPPPLPIPPFSIPCTDTLPASPPSGVPVRP